MSSNNEHFVSKGLALRDDLKHSDLVRVVFGPHAPYTVSDEPLQKHAFWNPSQARFLEEALEQDSDWAEVVDELLEWCLGADESGLAYAIRTLAILAPGDPRVSPHLVRALGPGLPERRRTTTLPALNSAVSVPRAFLRYSIRIAVRIPRDPDGMP